MFDASPNKRMLQSVVFCSAFLTVAILLHIFIGRPVIRYLNDLREEFKARQEKIQESQDLIRKFPNPQKAIEEVEKKVQEFRDMGVSRRQLPRIIQLLGRSTPENKIEVISIRPREDMKSVNESLPAGVTKVYIEMVISCSYKMLGEYIKTLSELPSSFTIESMIIEKTGAEADISGAKKISDKQESKEMSGLLCTLFLSTYLIWEI